MKYCTFKTLQKFIRNNTIDETKTFKAKKKTITNFKKHSFFILNLIDYQNLKIIRHQYFTIIAIKSKHKMTIKPCILLQITL